MNDDQFDILANEDRRQLLWRLGEPGTDAVTIPEDVHTGDRPARVLHTAMRHRHLPKLRDAGYVRWNPEGDVVLRGPKFGELQPLLRVLRDVDGPQSASR